MGKLLGIGGIIVLIIGVVVFIFISTIITILANIGLLPYNFHVEKASFNYAYDLYADDYYKVLSAYNLSSDFYNDYSFEDFSLYASTFGEGNLGFEELESIYEESKDFYKVILSNLTYNEVVIEIRPERYDDDIKHNKHEHNTSGNIKYCLFEWSSLVRAYNIVSPLNNGLFVDNYNAIEIKDEVYNGIIIKSSYGSDIFAVENSKIVGIISEGVSTSIVLESGKRYYAYENIFLDTNIAINSSISMGTQIGHVNNYIKGIGYCLKLKMYVDYGGDDIYINPYEFLKLVQ